MTAPGTPDRILLRLQDALATAVAAVPVAVSLFIHHQPPFPDDPGNPATPLIMALLAHQLVLLGLAAVPPAGSRRPPRPAALRGHLLRLPATTAWTALVAHVAPGFDMHPAVQLAIHGGIAAAAGIALVLTLRAQDLFRPPRPRAT